MTWFAHNKDLVSIVLALIAILLSLMAVVLGRRQQRISAFIQIQGVLLAPSSRQGRRLAYALGSGDSIPDYQSADMRLIDEAMGDLNLLAVFVHRGVVPERWALDMWHRPLRNIKPGYEALLRLHREHWLESVTNWPDLHYLIEDAERYSCRLPCCTPVDGAPEHRADQRPDDPNPTHSQEPLY